ncbi:neuromedin-U receptor 2 [Fopius arisanus]|uniref:Neuromedin-U receptor 2 n=1 Tax=Fopius arisanus TaxID=64838 RepID=A0A0C9RY41_9HYME|nr:PREDICTED: neuromedin-U receptor 2-like [Fopius arisanus]XP_011309956.1 PREDICTED: neuromedin-U receptor 2-like [Fopius arisanus]
MRQGMREDRSTIDKFPFGINSVVHTSITEISRFSDNNTVNNPELIPTEGFNQTTPKRDALYIVIPITIIYMAIFITGLVGNVSTCVVIARNRSMHTATNYYLFSLAISDLLLLVSGLPPEMYYIWSHFPYVFGEGFCIIQSFAAETSANATVLTITAFTVERYFAICHPFLSHTMSKLSRAVKYVILIWILALCLAIPQAIQFGITFSQTLNGTAIPGTAACSVKWEIIDHAFEISTILFFVLPMTIITVLYVLIGIKLRRSRLLVAVKRNPMPGSLNSSESGRSRVSSQRNVIRMLVAVVVAFFICWAPFHAQRLLAVYAKSIGDAGGQSLVTIYTILTYISGIFYYLSTTVNPLLYNIMSHKFREAFKGMLADRCGARRSIQRASPRRQTYTSLSKYQKSMSRRPELNSGSYSASDDTQRLTAIVRGVEIEGKNCERPEVMDERGESVPEGMPGVTGCDRKPGRTRGTCSDPEEVTVPEKIIDDESRVKDTVSHKCLIVQRPIKTVSIGLIAERLRSGTKELFAHQQKQVKSRMRPELSQRAQSIIQSRTSIESANTISNSSLQDLDETEFTGSELAEYMGKVNIELVT